jgi:hypothetical protein
MAPLTMLKTAHFALALSLLLSLASAGDASAKPGASFSRGFSSHASSSHASTSHAAPSAPKPGSGSFGSFGRAQAAPRQSDSALSQQLSKQSSQARALETLDQRNAARAARNAPQPAPANAAPVPPAGMPAPAAPTTVVVHQDGGGLGHVIAGAMIARSVNAHAQGGYYPAPGYNGGYNNGVNAPASAPHRGSSFFSPLVTLCLMALIAWGLWFAWRGLRRRRAAIEAANKPNYSFERN